MASTITVKSTLDWAAAFIQQRPTTGVGSIANEPGLTAANKIMQTILSAPFRWAWNRKEVTFATTAPTGAVGVSDYSQALSDFGWLEKATYTLASATPPVKEMEIFQVLASDTKANPPQKIAPVLDDNAGNITMRLMPAPDAVYTIKLTYQKAPILLTALGQNTWTPIPDKYGFLYQQAMLAHMQGIYNAQLYALNMAMFFRQLVGAAEGLSETEKNIFLEDRLRELRMQSTTLAGASQGKGVRI